MTTVLCVRESVDGKQVGVDAHLLELWKQFNSEFPTEQHCFEALCKKALEEGISRCRNCGKRQRSRKAGNRIIKCRYCRHSTWLTAGTFFHHIRLARPWLAAIWLMEHGVLISTSRFHKLLGIAYSTAWNIFKKLNTVILNEIEERSLTVSSSEFSSLICRRSRETPARSHPLAEQENSGFHQERSCSTIGAELDSGPSQNSKKVLPNPVGLQEKGGGGLFDSDNVCKNNSTQLTSSEQQIQKLLQGQKMHFDQLCEETGLRAGELSAALTLLELAGLVVRLAGDNYAESASVAQKVVPNNSVRYSAESRTTESETITSVLSFVRICFQGVSRKYLQHFLAAHWCYTDRVRWRAGSLLQACIQFGPICERKIVEYVTPAMVKIVPCL